MPKVDPLSNLAFKYGSDKCPQLKHCYTPFYYKLFKDKRYSIKKVLEMGIGNRRLRGPDYVTGASLFMWRDFFPNAQIYGADNDPETIFDDRRIKTFLCDETKKEDLENLINKTGRDIDIFIDDGSHYSRHQIFLCNTLMPQFNKDIMYFIEDVGLPHTVSRHLSDYDCLIPELPQKKHYKKSRDIIITVMHRK